jgi:hypothetical protein
MRASGGASVDSIKQEWQCQNRSEAVEARASANLGLEGMEAARIDCINMVDSLPAV